MALRTLLKFRNLDLSKDINDRYTKLFKPGVFEGGELVPASGALKVDIVAPWKIISAEGMVIEETSDSKRIGNTGLEISAGQQTYVTVKATYQENSNPIVEYHAIEKSVFESLADKEYHVIFALLDIPVGASLMLSSYIRYAERDVVDKLGRSLLRGLYANSSQLPSAKDNVAGDLWVVANGIGGIPHIYGWDGLQWIIMTDAATAMANLSTHRSNLYTDEKHLTDNEKDAVSDPSIVPIRTSGVTPSATNPFIDNADPRIPNQNENNALKGTDGDPADSNRYVTEEYPWAVPEEIPVLSSSGLVYSEYVYVPSIYGPFFIGKRSDSSPEKAAAYFKLYDATLNREYTTTIYHPTFPSTAVTILGLYKSSTFTLANIIDPARPDADLDGFYTGDVYIRWDIRPDTNFRIVYAKKEWMKRLFDGVNPYHPFPDIALRLKANDAQIPASVIKAIEDIKGRDFDDTPPVSEQNINIRINVVGTKEYVGAVFKSDNVLSDFSNVAGVPAFGNDFVNNIGIPQNYSFENSGLSSVGYDLGTITYGATVDLSSVTINQDVFIDGSLNEYRVLSKSTNTVTIQKRNGKVPRSIDTTLYLTGNLTLDSKVVTNIPSTVGLYTSMIVKGNVNIPSGTIISSIDSVTQITISNAATATILASPFVAVPNTQPNNFYIRGSIKKDNNPRKINLATLDYIIGRDRIMCRQIRAVPNEFHPSTDNVAYEIFTPIHSATHKEPRVRFYGGFKNREAGNRSRVVATGTGSILVTGFFTDLFLLADIKNPAPVITVFVDGDPIGTTPTIPNVADSNGFENELDLQHQYLKMNATTLTDLVPHTVEISIANATDDFIIYGFDLIRNTVSNVEVLPGRAFVQSDLFQKNTLDSSIALPRGGYGLSYIRGKGMVSTRYVNRQLAEYTQTTTLFDMDGADDIYIPKGPVNNSVPTFGPTQGLTKFSYYQEGDIVKLIVDGVSAEAQKEQIFLINSISGGTANFSTPVVITGGTKTATLVHIASTTGDCYDSLREFNRYMFTDMGVKQSSDFAYLVQYGTATNKLFTLEDGTTAIAGKTIKYVNTGIEGADIALSLEGASSELRIRVVASQLDLLVVNTSTISGSVYVDGSPVVTVSFTGAGLNKKTIFTNARYQSHEILITGAAGLNVVGFIVYEPDHSVKLEGSSLATQRIIANYDSSYAYGGPNAGSSLYCSMMPTGVVAVDPYKMGGLFVNATGSDWTTTIDFVTPNVSNPAWGRYTYTDQNNAYFEYTFLGCGFEIEFMSGTNRGYCSIYLNNGSGQRLVTTTNYPSATLKNIDGSNGNVDMYQLLASRRKFGVSGLTSGLWTITVLCTHTKNGTSSAYLINIGTVYEINGDGYYSYSPSKGFRGATGTEDFVYGMDWVKDERTFDSGFAIKEDIPSKTKVNTQAITLQDIRTDKITLTSGSAVAVTFPAPFSDADYIVSYYVVNPSVPSVVMCSPSSLTATGFTANFLVVLTSGTLVYTATKYL